MKPEDLPDPTSVDKQFVYLIAKSDDNHFRFQKEARIMLSYKNGMVFIQTDKPVYTPNQSGEYNVLVQILTSQTTGIFSCFQNIQRKLLYFAVKIRVIPLEFDMTPSNKKVGLLYFLKLLILQLSLQAKFLLYRAA